MTGTYAATPTAAHNVATRCVTLAGMTRPEDLITTRDLCEWADIDRATLGRHIQQGKITPAMRSGRAKNSAMLFNRADVAVYIARIKPERVA